MSVYQLGNLRVVDLTKVLDPKTESRRCGLTRFNTGGPIPDFHTIMDLTSHLGTHCECPYHHDDNWPSVADLPLTTFLGRAIYVDFKDTVAPRTHITAADLDRATAGKIKEGDIVIIDSSYKIPPFTPKTNTEEDKRKLEGIWDYLRAASPALYRRGRMKVLNLGANLPTELGRRIGIGGYHVAQRIFKFN